MENFSKIENSNILLLNLEGESNDMRQLSPVEPKDIIPKGMHSTNVALVANWSITKMKIHFAACLGSHIWCLWFAQGQGNATLS